MFDIKGTLIEMFHDWLTDILTAIFNFLAEVLFDHKAMSGLFENVYGIFVVFGGTLLVAIVLFRIISSMLNEAEGGEARLAEILISTIKASAMVLILPFMLYLVVNKIVYPIGEYMFKNIAEGTADSITNMLDSSFLEKIIGSSDGIVSILLLAFIVIVFIVFTFKMCVYHADLLLLEIMSVGAAISIASEKFDFSEVWWREFLSQILTVITQTLMMAGIVQLVSHFNSWYDFMLIIGLGVLIIRGPSVLRSMWYSSGGGRGAVNMSKTATRMLMMKMFR